MESILISCVMPHASGPETPPFTASTSLISFIIINDFIDCEKGSVDEDEDEEIIEIIDEKGSPDGFSNYQKENERSRLVQRSKVASYAWLNIMLYNL